jgi:hypothetical protein
VNGQWPRPNALWPTTRNRCDRRRQGLWNGPIQGETDASCGREKAPKCQKRDFDHGRLIEIWPAADVAFGGPLRATQLDSAAAGQGNRTRRWLITPCANFKARRFLEGTVLDLSHPKRKSELGFRTTCSQFNPQGTYLTARYNHECSLSKAIRHTAPSGPGR